MQGQLLLYKKNLAVIINRVKGINSGKDNFKLNFLKINEDLLLNLKLFIQP